MDFTPLIPCGNIPSVSCDLYIATLFLPSRLIIRSTNSLSIKRVINLDPLYAKGVYHLKWNKDTNNHKILIADSKCVRAYDMENEQWELCIDENLGGVRNVEWSKSGTSILIWSDFQLKLTVWSITGSTGSIFADPKFPSKGFVDRSDTSGIAILLQRTSHDLVSIISTTADDWRVIKTFSVTTSDAHGLACSPDGQWIAVWDTCVDYRLTIYTVDGRLVRTFEAYQVGLGIKTVEWSPHGDYLAIGSYDNKVRFLNNLTFSPVIDLSHNPTIRSENTVVWRQIVSGTFFRYDEADQPISPPYIRSASTENTLKLGVSLLLFSPDGSFLVTRTENMPTTLWIWSLREMSPIAVMIHLNPVRTVEWHPEEVGQLIFTCQGSSIHENNAVYLWDINWHEPRMVSVPRDGFEVRWFKLIPSGAEKENGIVLGSGEFFTIGYPVVSGTDEFGTIAEEEGEEQEDTLLADRANSLSSTLKHTFAEGQALAATRPSKSPEWLPGLLQVC